MRWIGITGPMGGGKSTIAGLLRQKGFPVLDADQVVHQVLRPGGTAETLVLKTFGEDLRGGDGHLDRRALGRRVFSDPSQLTALENILHPLVREEVKRQREELGRQGHQAVFYDVPLLFEKNMQSQFDGVIVVTAPEDVRRLRLFARSGLTQAEVDQRSRHQLPAAEKERLADVVIRNLGNLHDLENDLLKALSTLKVVLPAST